MSWFIKLIKPWQKLRDGVGALWNDPIYLWDDPVADWNDRPPASAWYIKNPS